MRVTAVILSQAMWVLAYVFSIQTACATTTLEYDVIAAARDDVGNGVFSYFSNAYNAAHSISDTLVSDAAQIYSFSAAFSGSSTIDGPSAPANNSASVTAMASIDYGELRASIYGTGTTDTGPSRFGRFGDNRWAAIDGGNINAIVRDSLAITSDTLPSGTPVQVEVGVYFHAKVGAVGWPSGNCNCAFSQQMPFADLFFAGVVRGVASWDSLNQATLNEATFTDTYVFDTTVGGTLPLLTRLRLRGGLNAYAPVGDIDFGPYTDLNVSGFADASSTALMSVRILTPGVSYVAESDTLYPEILSVPEPQMVVLWAFGGALIGWRARQQRRLGNPDIAG